MSILHILFYIRALRKVDPFISIFATILLHLCVIFPQLYFVSHLYIYLYNICMYTVYFWCVPRVYSDVLQMGEQEEHIKSRVYPVYTWQPHHVVKIYGGIVDIFWRLEYFLISQGYNSRGGVLKSRIIFICTLSLYIFFLRLHTINAHVRYAVVRQEFIGVLSRVFSG